MTDDLRTRIADVQRFHIPVDYAGYIECSCGTECKPDHGGIDVAEQLWSDHVADAVMNMLTVHIPPIVASAIHSYADSELMAMSYHGDPSGLAAMKKLNQEAAQIANYATKHERWNGHAK